MIPNDPAAPLANDTAAPLGSAAPPADRPPGDVLAEHQGVQAAEAVGVPNSSPSVSPTSESSTGPGPDRSASDHAVFIDWFGDGSVAVVDLALACCAVESELAAPLDAPRTAQPSSGAKVVAVVSGTLTDALAPTVGDAVASLPDPFVVAFGGCACIGGPYWDSYSVTKGVDQLMPVDAFVPGCPPPPGALDEVVRAVRANSFKPAQVRAS